MQRQKREHRRGCNGKSTSKNRPITRSQTKRRQATKYKAPSQWSNKNGSKNSGESKAVPTCNINGELAERITQHSKHIELYANFSELSSYLIQEGVLSHEQNERILSEASNGEKTSRVLGSLAAKPNGFNKFLTSIKGETSHMGHAYIAALLEGRQYASESELKVSAECKERINNNLVQLSKGVHLRSLVPHLKQTFYLPSIRGKMQLLTDDEAEILLLGYEETHQERVMKLFLILETKGPLAHSQFVRCMRAEGEHNTHRQLFQDFFGDLNLSLSPVVSSEVYEDGVGSSRQAHERKNEEWLSPDETSDDELVPLTPAKRACGTPIKTWLETDGVLEGDAYAKLMEKFYALHEIRDGHQKLQIEAEEAIAQMDTPLELQALYRIELARSFIFRTQLQNDRAVELLTAALDVCHKMPGSSSNAFFIIGRCHHTLADLYRCANDYDRAKDHSMRALQTLQCVKPGLDTAIAYYVYACILLECNPSAVGADVQTIERAFHSAIDCGHGNDIARRSIVPQSHCRLAQMYMGSTQYNAGDKDSIENLEKARQSLNACKSDFDDVSQQSKYLYYVIESDWCRNTGDVTKAVDCARTACRIVEGTLCNGSPSAEARLVSLK